MKLIAIETSCDETAVAVLECSGSINDATFKVLGNALYSQAHLHAEHGGVFPTLAKREHIKNLPELFKQVEAIAAGAELIAVTAGPGLEPALWAGIDFARELGEKLHIPVVGANHMEGHIVSALVTGDETSFTLGNQQFPMLALLMSGGHTEFQLMNKWHLYEKIGGTKDDAIGEAFDKVARLLGLPYPGGPKLAAAAASSRASGKKHEIVFPRPLQHEASCDFSFSGLKTAVLYKLNELNTVAPLTESMREHVAEAFEDAARDITVIKTRRALIETGAQTLAVGGGVSANLEIRDALTKLIFDEFPSTQLYYPHKSLTGDNAVMIGMAAYLRHANNTEPLPLTARGRASL